MQQKQSKQTTTPQISPEDKTQKDKFAKLIAITAMFEGMILIGCIFFYMNHMPFNGYVDVLKLIGISALFAGVILFAVNEKINAIELPVQLLMVFRFLLFTTLTAAMFLISYTTNCLLDQSEEVQINSQVVGKYALQSSKSSSYFLEYTDDSGSKKNLSVSRDIYTSAKENESKLNVSYKTGYLKIPWIKEFTIE